MITAAFDQSRSEQPSTSQLAGADILVQEGKSFSLGASELLPWGGTASFSFNGSRSTTNSTFSSINPYYTAGLSLSLTQPLLSGFGLAATHYSIEIQIWGEGRAIVFRDGQAFEGRWLRPQRPDLIRFVDEAGNPIPLKPGNTWIQVVPFGFEIEVEQ